jgi:peptidoglycan/LPS O-acetylase OafA/YrhL
LSQLLAPAQGPVGSAGAASGRARAARIAGLDGLRAIAVVGVLLYHAGVSWIPGGLLGVDVFFVISGFLITTLLLDERARTGRTALRAFWTRRLRRLLPALIVMLLFVSVVWGLVLKQDVGSLRRDVLFAFGYSANWWFAFSGQGYFQLLNAPSPVLHTWSLAVEEQFYLIWPIAVAALLSHGRRVGRWAAAGAAVAAIATLVQSLAGVWTDRLYYGTDTRAVPLLVGAAFGAWYFHHRRTLRLDRQAQVVLRCLGLLALAVVGWAFARLDGQSAVLYRGGFLALAIAVSVLIVTVAVDPGGPLARVLEWRPLRYLGTISYGLYLWHWPLFLLVNHARTGLSGTGLLATRLALAFTVAAVSYEFFELPIRRGGFHLPRPRLTAPIALAAVVGVLLAATPPQTSSPAVANSASQRVAPGARVGSKIAPQAPVGTTRVLVVGDSLALTLTNGLSVNEVPYKVHLDNAGELGCGVSQENRRLQGQFNAPPAYCLTWPQDRARTVATDHPDLVALLVGRWEVTDTYHDGSWEHVGEPDFDAYVSGELDRAIDVLSSTGAPVALLTMPCVSATESPDGSPYPEDDPARVTRFNQLLVEAQARHPATSRLVDLNAMVCPGGVYTSTLDGVTVRTTDGVHFPITGVAPLAARLLPQLRELSVAAVRARQAAHPAQATPSAH